MRLLPAGLESLLGIPGREVVGDIVPLVDLRRELAAELLERLHDARSVAASVRLLNRALTHRAARIGAGTRDVIRSAERLFASEGALPVSVSPPRSASAVARSSDASRSWSA